MTFQQLEYIVAVEKYRHFVNAAAACGVTQSTLSSMVQKLEQEMDVIIFDRTKHPIEPTTLGRQIIAQARLILHTSAQLRELVVNEREQEHTTLYIGLSETIGQAIYPAFNRILTMSYPGIHAGIYSDDETTLLARLEHTELDMVIAPIMQERPSSLMEIELFTERLVSYISPAHPLSQRPWVRPEDLMDGKLWRLKSFHGRCPQLGDLLLNDVSHHTDFEQGDLATLVALVDENGGHTLLPQLFTRCLTDEQRKNIRTVNSGTFFRTVALYIRSDYLRERMLNIVADVVKRVIPDDMVSPRLKKFKITL